MRLLNICEDQDFKIKYTAAQSHKFMLHNMLSDKQSYNFSFRNIASINTNMEIKYDV